MDNRQTENFFVLLLLFLMSLSEYRIASNGDILAAILIGLRMLITTVRTVNIIAPININGDSQKVCC